MGWRFPHALRATWELHASVHEPTRGTSLFQICVTAFAYISILSCFSVHSVVVFFLFFFSCFSLVWTPAQAVQISRTAVLSWPSGSPCYDGHAGKISAYAGESSFSTPVMIDHVRMHEWRWWNESSCQHLPVPSASYALRVHPVSPLHNWSSPIWSCSTMLLTPPLFFFKPPSPFFGQTFWTVHWQILYKIAI